MDRQRMALKPKDCGYVFLVTFWAISAHAGAAGGPVPPVQSAPSKPTLINEFDVIVAAVVAILLAGCTIFDRFFLPQRKTKVGTRLWEFYGAIEKATFKDLAKLAATWAITAAQRCLPHYIWSLQGIFFWTCVSWLLTSAAANLDYHMLERTAHPEALHGLTLPEFAAYLANWIFDLIIFSTTSYVVAQIRDNERRGAVVGILFANAALITVIYLACTTTAIFGYEFSNKWQLMGSDKPRRERLIHLRTSLAQDPTYKLKATEDILDYSAPLPLSESFACARDSIQLAMQRGELKPRRDWPCKIHYIGHFAREGKATSFEIDLPLHPNYTISVTCATVFVPSLAFLFFLACLMAYKLLLEIILFFLQGVLNEKDLSPGAALNSLIVFVGALVCGIAKILQLYRG